MFKLESYITPILLSYVDKYIKNFRPEDSQVSLWGGDASFHNLDLRLEVLEQELQLPFSFVSGHIHELLIHVPWTKLASEPITITINTIECILKLKGAEESGVSSDTSSQNKEKLKRTPARKQEVEAPPGYVQSLINKIVSNIRIYCNNLILKYVEEDIVLSMNVKLLTFESADEKWGAAYTDLSSAQVILRKLITLNDLTLCLDKRNASGKIDVYQEPMLYRCSLTMHLLRNYHSATANRASTTRLDIYCNRMEFSMTELQVPMLVRLIALILALQQKQFRQDNDGRRESFNSGSESGETSETQESWAGWAWSFVPSILPVAWDEDWNREQELAQSGHTFHMGFYVDNAFVTFKVSETSTDRGYYSQRKLRYWPLLSLHIQGVFMETILHGVKWFNASFGISQAVLVPIGYCSCGISEFNEGSAAPQYLSAGSPTTSHKTDSLFDVEAAENKGQKRAYNFSWDFHLASLTEAVLLERTPALALDYLYQLDVPDDMSSERLSELGSDLEFSNLSERSLTRLVVGPFKLRVCSGLFHRLGSLRVAASTYDYPPYSVPKPEPLLSELLPPSEEDYDALNECIPSRTTQITVFAPIIEVQMMDHPYFEPQKGSLFRKRKKLSIGNPSSQNLRELPSITLECQCIDVKISNPMYFKRLIYMTCQLPDPPQHMFEMCYTDTSVKVINFCSHLNMSSEKRTTILMPCSASYTSRDILKPQYWVNPDVPHEELTFEAEAFTVTGTKAKMMVVMDIIAKLVKVDADGFTNSLLNTSLLQDATRDYRLPVLEFCMEGVRFKRVQTKCTVTVDISLSSVEAFVFEPVEQAQQSDDAAKSDSSKFTFNTSSSNLEMQQVLFICGPEPDLRSKSQLSMQDESPLLTATIQYPLVPDDQPHPSVLIFNMKEIRFCIDPLLCRWLLYSPRTVYLEAATFDPLIRTKRNLLEATGAAPEAPRRAGTPLESIHSSSDREPLLMPGKPAKIEKDEDIDFQEKIYNFLKKWFDVWRGMLIYGDLSHCTIYFPLSSLSAVGSQGIQEAIDSALKKGANPEILVLTLPHANIRSASQKHSLSKYATALPIRLPENMWSANKTSFPWSMTLTDCSLYTLHQRYKFYFLKPVSLSATVGLSTKPSKDVKSPGEGANNVKSESTSPVPPIPGTSKGDVESLGVCVHIDMTPVNISTSEVQVCLMASVLYGLLELIDTLSPPEPSEAPESPEIIPPLMTKSSSKSPTIYKDSTADSVSENAVQTLQAEKAELDVKLTAWVQWTVARFTLEMFAHEAENPGVSDLSYVEKLTLKLVIDAEDIVSSLDFQSVYLKIKSKIGSANIRHFERVGMSSKWMPGIFLGIIMLGKEDSSAESQEDTSFANITITRASCHHTHSLWGAVRKTKFKDKKDNQILENHQHSRYITEIVVNLQPVDFILPISTLKSFYMVVEPLMNVPVKHQKSEGTTNILKYLNSSCLPLAYLECHGIRVIIPSVELGGRGVEQDVCMFQVDRINLNPSAVNPICRTPVRPDIYQCAAQARILNIPGSEVEDRQYQLDVIGMSMNTGIWEELDPILTAKASNILSQSALNENPAFEWNNLEGGRLCITPHLDLWPVINKFDITIVAAPALIYRKDTVVCGHSVEVNLVSDIDINLCLSQIQLASAIMQECLYLLEPFYTDIGITRRPKISLPYVVYESTSLETLLQEDIETIAVDVVPDSGIELSDVKSVSVCDTNKEIGINVSSFACFKPCPSERTDTKTTVSFPRPPNPLPSSQQSVPMEMFFAGGKITFVLYNLETVTPTNNKNVKRKRESIDKRESVNKEDESEQGYEGSEEGSIDDTVQYGRKEFEPLVFVCVSEPNAFLSRHQLSRKIQLSCFNVNMKIGDHKRKGLNHMPMESDFAISLLETRRGSPDPDNGIPPAFFTANWVKSVGKPPSLCVQIGKPTRILCSMTRWHHLLTLKDKILLNFQHTYGGSTRNFNISGRNISGLSTARGSKKSFESPSNLWVIHKDAKHNKFREIRENLYNINDLNIKLAQLVLVFKSSDESEVSVSLGNIKSHISLNNRPERVTNVTNLEYVAIGVMINETTTLILNPWTASFEVCLYWESWQSSDNDPRVQVSIDSDCFIFDINPEQVKIVRKIVHELNDFLVKHCNYEESAETSVTNPASELCHVEKEKEQHYKDDLRAGAFQFVDSVTNNADELPLPYQVMFWSQNICAMAWRYPQPRALTKVRVFPVPYKITGGSEDDLHVTGYLEYWSECQGCYIPCSHFSLSETEMCHLELPSGNPKPPVSCTWRVRLDPTNSSFDDLLLSPRALAACMRIDSYFNKNLIPNVSVAVHISKISISLYNHIDKLVQVKMPEPLNAFTCDMLFPDTQGFATFTIDSLNAYLTYWDVQTALLNVNGTLQCTVLDYSYLTQQTFLEPFSCAVEMSLSNNIAVNIISKPVHIRFGPCIAHTLAVSAHLWEQSLNSSNDSTSLVLMTHYIVCNDTNLNLRFGQKDTEEDILLPSRYCHLYCWRSQKNKQMLRVGLEQNGWVWSFPFAIMNEGTQFCKIATKNPLTIVVTVKNLSATQKQVIFSGQLIISNMLSEQFEVKVVNANAEDKEMEFRQTPNYIVDGQCTPPSLVLDTSKKHFLRVRFFGLDSAWSGDIPLVENTKCTQPWLVKVPLQDRGQFLSIWCRIVKQEIAGGSKILAMLWPLFMVRSNLPINVKVHIETPTLNVHLESVVKGRGEYQQLHCPGTMDHSHQLSFQLNGGTPTSNPYVPLNYSLVDQKQFFKKLDNVDISDILNVINNYTRTKWPYSDDELDEIEWITEDQPLTHVQVRYQNACQYSSALLVELLPWSLLVNILGCTIAIIENEKELCRVCHHGIVTPPKLEDTFHIGVGIGGTWNISSPLQLAKSDWSQAFYMPKINGTIPLEGCIKTPIKCGPNVCMVSISSIIWNEIRLLKVSSTHVVTNYLTRQVHVACFAVPDVEECYDFPDNVKAYSFTVQPHMGESKTGISIMQWYLIDTTNETCVDYALYISFSAEPDSAWSCPVRVDNPFLRRSITVCLDDCSIPLVLTCQEHKGQFYLSLHYDSHPQMLIENNCDAKLYCAQFVDGDVGPILNESQHFHWLCEIGSNFSSYYSMPAISERFPDVSPGNYPDKLCFSSAPQAEAEAMPWSAPISLTNYNEQFIKVPFYSDVRVTIVNTVRTILVVLETSEEMQVSASGIRDRLLLNSNMDTLLFKQRSDSDDPRKPVQISVSDTQLNQSTSPDDISSISEEYFAVNHSQNFGFGMPTLTEQSSLDVTTKRDLHMYLSEFELYRPIHVISSKSLYQVSTLPMRQEWDAFMITAFVRSISVVFTLDLEDGGIQRHEIINFVCDNVAVKVLQQEAMEVNINISDIQIDNQLFFQSSYDFPVVLINQEFKKHPELTTLNTDITQWMELAVENSIISVELSVETWKEELRQRNVTDVKTISIGISPLSLFIEDTYITCLMDYLKTFTPTNLIVWSGRENSVKYNLSGSLVKVPEIVAWESVVIAKPLSLRSFSIEPLSLLLSVHSSVKMYIALDKSPLQFGRFERRQVLTTPYRLGHALTMHYLSGAIFGAGWVVGSLELLGSPGGLARAMGTGLRDFVSMPYQGLIQGPWAFLRGITHGSASLMKHVTAGTLQSVTKLASSVARNLDRLTLDEEHLKRTEEQRRQKPQGVTQGFMQGLTGLGISLLGAVGGIAHHPLQSVMAEGASPRSLAAGVGLGLVGVFTKPLSGAAELLALTGQGLLQGAGWNPLPEPRSHPVLSHVFSHTNSHLKYNWKFMQLISEKHLLFITEATHINSSSDYSAIALILTSDALIIINTDEDVTNKCISLTEVGRVENSGDPTLLSLKLCSPALPTIKYEDDCAIEMDPECRKRVANYVRSTTGLMLLSDDLSVDHSEMSISPISTPTPSADYSNPLEQKTLTFYVSPQNRNHFINLLNLAKHQREGYNFPVL